MLKPILQNSLYYNSSFVILTKLKTFVNKFFNQIGAFY